MAVNKGKTQSSDSTPRIEYSGFKDMDAGDMAQIQKVAEEFTEKIASHGQHFNRVGIRCKQIHKVEHNQKFEISVSIESAKMHRSAEVIDKNPFKALEISFKKLLFELEKMH
jgi:hypothetical protein